MSIDYGPVGKGASAAHGVLATNGQEYLIKGRAFSPSHPYVAANELVAARLGDHLGLSVLDYRILDMAGDLFFASSWMNNGSFALGITSDLLDRCANVGDLYRIVAFDVWIFNTDRHHENLIVRTITPRGSATPVHTLLLNDHSHCLVLPNEAPPVLATRVDQFSTSHVRLDFVLSRITDAGLLKTAIDSIQLVPDDVVRQVVESAPAAWLSTADRSNYITFLCERRDRLRQVILTARGFFTALGAGSL